MQYQQMSSPNFYTNLTPDIDSFDTLISDIDPFNLETFALASKSYLYFYQKLFIIYFVINST